MIRLVGCFVLLHVNPFQVTERRIKFQIIQFNISIVFVNKLLNIKTIQLNVKTVLFQMAHFSISTQFKCQNSYISSNSV